jgi:molybdenum cofactor cytidylyltransferase
VKFGSIPLARAEGTILAHSIGLADGPFKKGRLLSRADIEALAASGHTSVMAAELEPGDVGEDAAAERVACAIAGSGLSVAAPFTGRANIYADTSGIAVLDDVGLGRLNQLDEALTIATVRPFERVDRGQMIATVKVITFAVPQAVVDQAAALAAPALLRIAPFAPRAAGLILTRLTGTKDSVLLKRRTVMAHRLATLGCTLAETAIVAHDVAMVGPAIAAMTARGLDPVLVFAATAIVDRGDVIPAGLTAAGGEVVHLGMPVDPGNLIMIGRLGAADVIGVPSCAGSPKLNGFDWVLERRIAGLPAGPAEIAAMGVGGLLKEIPTRPQPRAGIRAASARREANIAAIVLAAGRSTRMGSNKLIEDVRGKPLVRHAVDAALASRARPVHVVTGHQAEAVRSVLDGLAVTMVANPEYGDGLSTSLRAGIASLADGVDGAIVLLGDMPEIAPAHIDSLIAAFAPDEGRAIVVPVRLGKRGNPVLWGAEFFPEMARLDGDAGARALIAANRDRVVEVDVGSDAILFDVDTPAALASLREKQ